jgi:hypothetical protein
MRPEAPALAEAAAIAITPPIGAPDGAGASRGTCGCEPSDESIAGSCHQTSETDTAAAMVKVTIRVGQVRGPSTTGITWSFSIRPGQSSMSQSCATVRWHRARDCGPACGTALVQVQVQE